VADTRGFETVVEVATSALREILRAAWKSGGDNGDPGVIPEFFDIPPGTAVGPYQLADGQVQIPQSQLDAAMAPAINGVQLNFGLDLQLHVQDPPVPSASMFDLQATVRPQAPVGLLGATKNVGILLDAANFPRANVAVTLTSGDPFAPRLDTFIAEYVHKKYEADGTSFPHTVSKTNQPIMVLGFQAYTVDLWADLYDDPADPARQITVGRPLPTQVRISVPLHLKVFNIRKNSNLAPLLHDPMGVETRVVIVAPFDNISGAYAAHFESSTVTVDPLVPSSIGNEGTNYTANKAKVLVLDTMMSEQIRQQGTSLAAGIGLVSLPSPTVAQIETAIGDVFYARLSAKGSIGIWTPEFGGNAPIQVNDLTVKALAQVLALAMNTSPGADAGSLANFVPANRDFAAAVDGQKVLAIIDQTIHRPENQGGFGANFPPKRFHNVNGHDADLTRLDVSLRSGAIHMEGDVTVIDAVAGSIDVDASFSEDVGLHWASNADGTQRMLADAGSPDVDLSLLAWIVSFLIGFITLGLVGGIIAIVVLLVVESIAERIGGALVRDQVTNEISGIGAWPGQLVHIGKVSARFVDSIGIEPSGIVVAGTMTVTSQAALTAVVPADAQGPYVVAGGALVTLAAGAQHPAATYDWLSGDGAVATTALISHRYGDDGVYVAKLTEVVNQPGGATSRNFGLVRVKDVPAVVRVGSDRTVNEGEVVSFTGTFQDAEWLDTHEATWDWGDSSRPDPGTISETNSPPQAQGSTTASHAWCDNGTYVVTLAVRDDGGAVGMDTLTVTVLNVAPSVETPAAIFAYPCTVLTLEGKFTDPGWCDTHTAIWEFGDCTPAETAVVEETNHPPAATGVATAAHIYEECGTYLATCVVTDKDGGAGASTTVVHVINVVNPGFEDGFRRRLVGATANGWEPYADARDVAVRGPQEALFAENLLVHSGRRAQRVRGAGQLRAGISQRVGANPGWEYQVSSWYSLAEGSTGWSRLGVDPRGGVEPTSPDIRWMRGSGRRAWETLMVRVIARAEAVTIFLEAGADGEAEFTDAVFDDVVLIAAQPRCPPVAPEPAATTCVDFAKLAPGSTVPGVYEHYGFAFEARDGRAQRIVDWGEPVAQSKLEMRAGGLVIRPPFRAQRMTLAVTLAGSPCVAAAYDLNGNEVAQKAVGAKGAQTIELAGAQIVAVHVAAAEAALVRVCAEPEWRAPVVRPDAGHGHEQPSLMAGRARISAQ
jgi:hypothetical protein